MVTCLGFVFFDRRRSKERGQYFRKFLGKIDEIGDKLNLRKTKKKLNLIIKLDFFLLYKDKPYGKKNSRFRKFKIWY
jgi:hypothetical protein